MAKRILILCAILYLVIPYILDKRSATEVLNGPYLDAEGSWINVNDFFRQRDCQFIALEFWASWCSPCQQLMPVLAQKALEWKKRGICIVGVNLEGDLQKAKEIQMAHNIHTPWLVDNKNRLKRFFRISTIPRMIIINKKGKIVIKDHPLKVYEEIEKGLLASSE